MKSYRPERIANVVRQVVSNAIATKLSDPRIAPMASITRVEVSSDLEHAKVFISVLGDEAVQRRTITGLQSARPTLQRLLGRAIQARALPRLNFLLDQSIKQAAETNRLIDEALAEDARRHDNGEVHEEGDDVTPLTDASADNAAGEDA